MVFQRFGNKKILITGGAGFIGANFVQYVRKLGNVRVVNLDKLTYAGNLENLKLSEEKKNYHFEKGDITDKEFVTNIFEKYKTKYVINFAAESHVDRSI